MALIAESAKSLTHVKESSVGCKSGVAPCTLQHVAPIAKVTIVSVLHIVDLLLVPLPWCHTDMLCFAHATYEVI